MTQHLAPVGANRIGMDQWWGKLREAVDAADAAIAKAEGRT